MNTYTHSYICGCGDIRSGNAWVTFWEIVFRKK